MTVNEMQRLQDEGAFQLSILGVEDWHSVLEHEVQLPDYMAEICRMKKMPQYDYLRHVARVNNESYERRIVHALLNTGYELYELEVEFKFRPQWGICVWQREHPSYTLRAHPRRYDDGLDLKLLHAQFHTEREGVQEHSLYSPSEPLRGGVNLNRALFFRKVVLLPPAAESANADSPAVAA